MCYSYDDDDDDDDDDRGVAQATSYGEVLLSAYVTSMYSTGMPILLAVAATVV